MEKSKIVNETNLDAYLIAGKQYIQMSHFPLLENVNFMAAVRCGKCRTLIMSYFADT